MNIKRASDRAVNVRCCCSILNLTQSQVVPMCAGTRTRKGPFPCEGKIINWPSRPGGRSTGLLRQSGDEFTGEAGRGHAVTWRSGLRRRRMLRCRAR